MPETLKLESEGAVLCVRLNRPEAKNAINEVMRRELIECFQEADADPSVRAILITGEGNAFCAGADLAPSDEPEKKNLKGVEKGSLLMEYRGSADGYRDLFKTYWELRTPVVSAVNGTVAGVGWMLALLADLVVAGEGGRWIHVFSERGMAPHAGDPYFLPRILPFHALNEIAMLGDRFVSEDMQRWGCVNRLVPPKQVESTAKELAERLSKGPTRSIGEAKRLYRRSLDSDILTAFGEEASSLALLAETHDRKEGIDSLLERRDPDFQGR